MATAEGNLQADAEAGGTTSSAPPPSVKARPKKRRPYIEEEDTPVIGGRFLIALGLVAVGTILPMSRLGEELEPRGPEPTDVASWQTGLSTVVRITLVTADYNLLACASELSFEGVHCAFKSPNEPWPRDPNKPPDDNKKDIIQPYRTWFDNKLVFVAGLWAQPEVADRLHREPSQGMQPDKLARFAVECRVKFAGRFDNVKLRWNPQQNWNSPEPHEPAWVGVAQDCKLIDESQ